MLDRLLTLFVAITPAVLLLVGMVGVCVSVAWVVTKALGPKG